MPSDNEDVVAETSRTFRLRDLLAECTTFPEISIEDAGEPLTFGIHSKVLGRPIPSQAVLSLAGALSRDGVGAELAIESTNWQTMVVTPANRWIKPARWEISLTLGWISPLCLVPHCRNPPLDRVIDHCDSHVTEYDAPLLITKAKWWAQDHRDHRDVHGANPESMGGDRKAEVLVRAAAAKGASKEVIETLLVTLFEREEDIEEGIEDGIWDEDEAMALRHAIDRERLRLKRHARDAARYISKCTAECPACGVAPPGHYRYDEAPPYPPQFCSLQCAASAQPAST